MNGKDADITIEMMSNDELRQLAGRLSNKSRRPNPELMERIQRALEPVEGEADEYRHRPGDGDWR